MRTDVHDVTTRSKNMRAIRHKDTEPELIVRRYLHKAGLRYRLHRPDLLGKPDIVLTRYSAVVFVHGCYWHRHPGCPKATTPKSNQDFWLPKLKRNRERDMEHQEALQAAGWRVFVIWECQLHADENLERLVEAIRKET